MTLHLISHNLCPYVQRAVISLTEKDVPYKRTMIDLANKPDWFTAISPLGKTPVLKADDTAIFESSVILEYLEETQPNPLHPNDPLERAQNRAWMEFGTAILNDIGGFYNAKDAGNFAAKRKALSDKFTRLEAELGDGPFFNGVGFTLVDTVFGPVFRYFDVFDQIKDFGILADKPKVQAWRKALANRPSVINAVDPDYNALLLAFLKGRNAHLGGLIAA
jgi:glutathione S-transferase